VIFATLSDLLPDLRAGNVRALAVTGTRRAGLMPQVPTLAESGYPGVSIAPWLGFFAPAGTPAEVIKRLVNGIADASAYGAVQQEFFKLGLDPVALTPAGFAGVLKSDLEAWGPLVKASGFTAED
jgi:tripartite-type tricarboxylate transporter receptor subunit TctC